MDFRVAPQQTSLWLDRLQGSGYRLTAARRAVVDVISASDRILTATQVYDLARIQCDTIGLVTVYRTLAKLEELALVERVHQSTDCHAFIATSSDHQHLLICQHCGRAEYFSGDRLEPLIEQVSRSSGYQISTHWLQLFGECGGCRQEKTG